MICCCPRGGRDDEETRYGKEMRSVRIRRGDNEARWRALQIWLHARRGDARAAKVADEREGKREEMSRGRNCSSSAPPSSREKLKLSEEQLRRLKRDAEPEASYGEEERRGAAAPIRARGTSALEASSKDGEDCRSARAGMWRCHISLGSKTGNLLCPSTNQREAQRAGRGAAALTSYGLKLGASEVGGKGRL